MPSTLQNGKRISILDHTGREIFGDEDDQDDGLDLPHIMTFGSIFRGAAYTYNHLWDEAAKHSRINSMAMRRDAWLMGLLRERADETLTKKWHLEVDNPKDPWQQTVCDGMTKIVKSIHRLKRMQRYLLQGALWYGRYGANVKWVWRDMMLPLMTKKGPATPGMKAQPTYAKGRVLTIAKHKPVNGDKIGHHDDDTPYVAINSAFEAKIKGQTKVIYPTNLGSAALLLRGTWREQILIHSSDPDDADYFEGEMGERVHGVGIRNYIYWLDFLRRDYFGAVTEMLNRVGLGLVVIYYDQSSDTAKTSALEMAKKFSRRAVVTMPRTNDGTQQAGGIEIVETPMAGATIMLDLQKHVEEQIERFMVGQLISGGGGTSNPLEGTGKSEFAKDSKTKLCMGDADDFDETMTGSEEEPGLVSIIKKWTYKLADFPVRYVTDHEEEDRGEALEAVKTCVDMGVSFDADKVRELTGQEPPEDGAVTIGGQEALDAKNQADLAALNGEEPVSNDTGADDQPPSFSGNQEEPEEYVVNYAGHDVSNEPRDEAGKWTTGGKAPHEHTQAEYTKVYRDTDKDPETRKAMHAAGFGGNWTQDVMQAIKQGKAVPQHIIETHVGAIEHQAKAKLKERFGEDYLAKMKEKAAKPIHEVLANHEDGSTTVRQRQQRDGSFHEHKKGDVVSQNGKPMIVAKAKKPAKMRHDGEIYAYTQNVTLREPKPKELQAANEAIASELAIVQHDSQQRNDSYPDLKKTAMIEHAKLTAAAFGQTEEAVKEPEPIKPAEPEREKPPPGELFQSDSPIENYADTIQGLIDRIRKQGGAMGGNEWVRKLAELLKAQPHLRRSLSPHDLAAIQAMGLSQYLDEEPPETYDFDRENYAFDPNEPRDAEGKWTTAQRIDFLLQNTGPKAASNDPVKLHGRAIPKGLDETALAVAKAVKAAGNPFMSPTIPDIVKAIKAKDPAAKTSDIHAALVKLHREDKIDLGPYTQGLATLGDEDIKHVIPLDRDPKYYVRPR